MTRWAPAIATLAVVVLAIAAVQRLAPLIRSDFPPFVMTIEQWDSDRGYRDGRTIEGTAVYRLEYQRRDDWTLTSLTDEVPHQPGEGMACRSGTYGSIDARGAFTALSRDSELCNGVGRWIHYGIASSYPWKKEVLGGLVTYTDPGERVVFDLATGLPLLYEAGLTTGAVGHREVFRVER